MDTSSLQSSAPLSLRRCKSVCRLGRAVLLVALMLSCFACGTKRSEVALRYWGAVSLAVGRQYVYVNTSSQGLVAVSRKGGEVAWRFPAELSPQSSVDNPSVHLVEDTIYYHDGHAIFALDPVSGELLWELQLEAQNIGHNMLLSASNDLVVVNTRSGVVHLIDTAQREIHWTHAIPLAQDNTLVPLSLTEQRVAILVGDLEYVGGTYVENAQLYVIATLTGEPLWSLDLGDGFDESALMPAVQDTDAGVFLAFRNGVMALNGMTGEVIWHSTWRHGNHNRLILVEGGLLAMGPTAMLGVASDSGEPFCRNAVAPWANPKDFLFRHGERLYLAYHTFERLRVLYWEVPIALEVTEIYQVDVANCKLELDTTLRGYLLAYDSETATGVVIPGPWHELTALKEVPLYLASD